MYLYGSVLNRYHWKLVNISVKTKMIARTSNRRWVHSDEELKPLLTVNAVIKIKTNVFWHRFRRMNFEDPFEKFWKWVVHHFILLSAPLFLNFYNKTYCRVRSKPLSSLTIPISSYHVNNLHHLTSRQLQWSLSIINFLNIFIEKVYCIMNNSVNSFYNELA